MNQSSNCTSNFEELVNMNGTVKWFKKDKGYGFIKGEDGVEYFVHYTSLPKGAFLKPDMAVTFEAAETEKGKQAKDVKVVGGQTSAPSRRGSKDDDSEMGSDSEGDADEEFDN